MVAQYFEPDEGSSGPSHTIVTPNLEEIITSSPAVVSQLPGLMRAMADEIERATHSATALEILEPCASTSARSMARKVAAELSVTLSQRLAFNHSFEAPGITRKPVEAAAKGLLRGLAIPAAHCIEGPSLRLKLLGTPEITLDGVRLTALERCGRASLIIYMLALHPRGLSAERLAAYIASESADVDAFDTDSTMRLGAVRTFIWRLRKLAHWRDIIISAGEQGGCPNKYRLPDNTVCDLWEFENTLDQAARLAVRASIEPEASDRAAILRQDAILLYEGEFCRGIGAGAVVGAAEYLRHRYLQAVMLQAIYWKNRATKSQEQRQEVGIQGRLSAEEENAWLEALSNYRLAAQAEPFDEAAYTGAMLCQAHLGNSKGVQETFARCSRIVKSELDRMPLATTMQAARIYMELAARQ